MCAPVEYEWLWDSVMLPNWPDTLLKTNYKRVNIKTIKIVTILFFFTKIEQKLKKSKKTRLSRNFQKNRKKHIFRGILKKVENNLFFAEYS